MTRKEQGEWVQWERASFGLFLEGPPGFSFVLRS